MADLRPFPADGLCPEHEWPLRLVERESRYDYWTLHRHPSGTWSASLVDEDAYHDDPESFEWVECPQCLARFTHPEELIYE